MIHAGEIMWTCQDVFIIILGYVAHPHTHTDKMHTYEHTQNMNMHTTHRHTCTQRYIAICAQTYMRALHMYTPDADVCGRV